MDPILLFANPIAGRGQGRLLADRLVARLQREGFEVRRFLEHADAVPQDQLPADAHAAIVIGGDGTLRTVARKLFEQQHFGDEASVGPPVLVVPMGTANLMGRHLGIDWHHEYFEDQIVQTIRQRRVVRLDTARANDRLFLLMAGIGLDAAVVHELDRLRKGPINMLSYILPTLLAVQQYVYPSLRVHADGRCVFEMAPAVAFVGNVPEYGTGFPMLPHARPDDGLLDLCVLPCSNPMQLARHVLDAAAGQHLFSEGVVYTKAKQVDIESNHPTPVQVDGEAAGHTPLSIDLLPVRIPFMVPA